MMNDCDALIAVWQITNRYPVAEVPAGNVGVAVEVAQELFLYSIGIDLIHNVTNKPKLVEPIYTVVYLTNRRDLISISKN
jgi:hypothetical protein